MTTKRMGYWLGLPVAVAVTGLAAGCSGSAAPATLTTTGTGTTAAFAGAAAPLSHAFTPSFPYTYEPGALGGVLSNIAVADGSVYVATIDLPFVLSSLSGVNGSPPASAVEAGEVEAIRLSTGKVEWDTKVSSLPLGAATVSGDLVFTTLYSGELVAFNRFSGAIAYEHKLPASTNAPIAVFGNTVLVPAGAPPTSAKAGSGGTPQLVAYTVP